MNTILIKPLQHYYGDIVRGIFIAVGVILLLGLPSFTSLTGMGFGFPIVSIVVLGLAAGLTSPIHKGSMIFNIAISICGLVFFTYVTWVMKTVYMGGFILFINKVIAVMFLVSLYLSIKSLRGFSLTNLTKS